MVFAGTIQSKIPGGRSHEENVECPAQMHHLWSRWRYAAFFVERSPPDPSLRSGRAKNTCLRIFTQGGEEDNG